MQAIEINSRIDYDLCISRGFEPLIDWRRFKMDIHLRVDIQRDIFGRVIFNRTLSVPKANLKFYHWNWEHRPHYCEESTAEIQVYSAMVISHILARGAHPDMAHDPRNVNILNGYYHPKWEDPDRRTGMKIYPANLIVIDLLNEDYKKLNHA